MMWFKAQRKVSLRVHVLGAPGFVLISAVNCLMNRRVILIFELRSQEREE